MSQRKAGKAGALRRNTRVRCQGCTRIEGQHGTLRGKEGDIPRPGLARQFEAFGVKARGPLQIGYPERDKRDAWFHTKGAFSCQLMNVEVMKF
jgi:hypothetical protein